MKKASATVISLAILAVMLIAGDVKLSAVKTRVATLTSVKGNVTVVLTGGDGQAKPASNNMVMNEGDEIKTSSGASAILRFDDGSMVKLGPLSKMKLGKLVGGGGTAQTRLDVGVGKTWTRVNKLDRNAKFEVKTPTAIAGVRGTYYSAEVDNDTTSRFDVFDGVVAVSSNADPTNEILVKQNQTTTVQQNKQPTPPAEIPKSQLEQDRGGFSEGEAAASVFDLRIDVSPPSIAPGGKSVVTIAVFRNGEQFRQEVPVKLKLGGNAIFVSTGTPEAEVSTGSDGSASLEITSQSEETVSVDAKLVVKVKKKKQ